MVQYFSEEQRNYAHRNCGLAIVSFALAAYLAGNAIDFHVQVLGLSFHDAMRQITGT